MVGKGKEALVCVADIQSFGSSIIKVYQAYSPVAKEFRRNTPHVKGWNASIAMVKREAQILEYLNQRNINAPKFYFLEGPVLVMELILHEKKVAPMLSKVNLKNYGDPKEFLVEALDILLEMFELGSLVHGDFSPQNLLVSDKGLIPIDFQQSRKINTKFFTSTPNRIRIDDALKTLRSDVITILQYFEKKYRLKLNLKEVYDRFCQTVPEHLLSKLESTWKLG
ncbi:MAG: hypothetical protein IH840_14445 [Candidatus Heimdallarchaeota archaeon]|nr:hypothetical protein [Candidatus Heimdallarchaeota archaeon]